MNQFIKFGFILGMICLAATLVLAVTYEVTRPTIEASLKKEEFEAIKRIVPEADDFKEKVVGEIDYFELLKDKKLIGYCIKVTGQGYGGYIRMLVGIDTRGVIKGVEVLEHYETPGLGSKIQEIKPGESEPWFLKQFKDKQAPGLEVRKNIDAITGATISSKAVTDAVRETVEKFLASIRQG